MKVPTTISTEPQLKQDFQDKFGKGTLSPMVESMMRKALNRDINAEDKFCYKCGRDDKAMIWDGWSNDWICNACNHAAIKSLKITGKSLRTVKGNE